MNYIKDGKLIKYKIYFIILHYLTIDDTMECVDSIQSLEGGKDVDIIIIDNNSTNGTGIELKERYSCCEQIEVVLLSSNNGFAKGNNVGYHIAKEKGADYIIFLNNDILIKQRDFLIKLINKYEQNQFHILGPDIVNLDGIHQNPHRNFGFTLRDINRIIRNRTIIRFYFGIVKFLKCEDRIKWLSLLEKAHEKAEQKNLVWDKEQDDVVLQGSAYIFSKNYIIENSYAFYPETFMYLEEEILYYIAHKRGYIIRYCPDIKVNHKWQCSTCEAMPSNYEKRRMQTEWTLNSAKIMKKLMKKKNINKNKF